MRGRQLLAIAGIWAIAAAALAGPALAASDPAGAPRRPGPRAYLIYLIDGADPIVVKQYVEDGDQIRFEKFGGWVGIPRYEVLRIVPDEPEAAAAPDAAPVVTAPPESDARLYVTTRDAGTVRATAVATEGARVRVSTPEGSLTLPRADLVGVLRLPAGAAAPEAWITLIGPDGARTASFVAEGAPAADPADGAAGPSGGGAPDTGGGPPLAMSDRPHLLQLAQGAVIHVDGFWIEDGEIRFRRLGGVVGFALAEVARLLPQEVESARGRVPMRFVRRLDADRLEVRVAQGVQRVRLIGVEPAPGRPVAEDPWAPLRPGLLVHLEFDRQRYGPEGDWLAYVYLPSGRMLNAELIRTGLARPRPEPRNVRYLDLFQELGTARQPGD